MRLPRKKRKKHLCLHLTNYTWGNWKQTSATYNAKATSLSHIACHRVSKLMHPTKRNQSCTRYSWIMRFKLTLFSANTAVLNHTTPAISMLMQKQSTAFVCFVCVCPHLRTVADCSCAWSQKVVSRVVCHIIQPYICKGADGCAVLSCVLGGDLSRYELGFCFQTKKYPGCFDIWDILTRVTCGSYKWFFV